MHMPASRMCGVLFHFFFLEVKWEEELMHMPAVMYLLSYVGTYSTYVLTYVLTCRVRMCVHTHLVIDIRIVTLATVQRLCAVEPSLPTALKHSYDRP